MILFRILHIHEHKGQENFEPRGFDQVQRDSDQGDFDQHDFDQGDFDQCDFDQRLSAVNFEHFPSDFVSLL